MQFFEIKVDLTLAGFEQRKRVVDCILSFIALVRDHVRRKTLPSYIFDELRQLSTTRFIFSEKGDVVDAAMSTAERMQIFSNPVLYLTGDRVFGKYYEKARARIAAVDDSRDAECNLDTVWINDCHLATQGYLEHFTVSNTVVKVISKVLFPSAVGDSHDVSAPTDDFKISEYYGAKYRIRDVSDYLVGWDRRLASSTINGGNCSTEDIVNMLVSKFSLPERNDLIATEFTLVHVKDEQSRDSDDSAASGPLSEAFTASSFRNEWVRHPPVLLKSTISQSGYELWHKQDIHFNQPKVHVIVNFALPDTLSYSPRLQSLISVFISCFHDAHKSYMYKANLAGLSVRISSSVSGLNLVFSGYTHKMSLFVRSIMEKLQNFALSDDSVQAFNRFKDLYKRQLNSWPSEQSYVHARYYLQLATLTQSFPREQFMAAANSMTFSDLNPAASGKSSFVVKALLSDGSHCTSLVMGSVDSISAGAMMADIRQVFPVSEPIPLHHRLKQKIILYPSSKELGVDGSQCKAHGCILTNKHPNLDNSNNAVIFSFQFPSAKIPTSSPANSIQHEAAIQQSSQLELLADIINQPFFNMLRTQQQCGYIVSSHVSYVDGVYMLSLLVQSSEKSCAELSARIEGFVNYFLRTELQSLTAGKFNAFRNGLITTKLQPDQRLTEQASRFWSEIMVAGNNCSSNDNRPEPLFYRQLDEVEALRRTSLSDIQSFAETLLSADSDERRLVVSQVESGREGESCVDESMANGDLSDSYTEHTEKGFLVPKWTLNYLKIEDAPAFRQSRPVC
jgi:secreted Zn-dependent insulinase-like peptidase